MVALGKFDCISVQSGVRQLTWGTEPQFDLWISFSTHLEIPCYEIKLCAFLIFQACRDGLTCVAEQLIKQNPSACNERDKDGLTPLHHATRGKSLQIIQSLLDAGAGEERLLLFERMIFQKVANGGQRSEWDSDIVFPYYLFYLIKGTVS